MARITVKSIGLLFLSLGLVACSESESKKSPFNQFYQSVKKLLVVGRHLARGLLLEEAKKKENPFTNRIQHVSDMKDIRNKQRR